MRGEGEDDGSGSGSGSGSGEDDDMMAVAERLIDKLRQFVGQLDDAERPLMAALLTPGIDAAWSDEAERAGLDFELSWTPRRLPAHLCDAVRQADLAISNSEIAEPSAGSGFDRGT